MTAFGVTFRRTVGAARNNYATAFILGGFLAATSVAFSFGLVAAEGMRTTGTLVWVRAMAPILPVLVALLGMDAWSEERRTGRIDILLSSPVTEGELVFGKFFGVFGLAMAMVIASFAVNFSALGILSGFCDLTSAGVVTALLALATQAALWSAVAVAVSAMFKTSAIAAFVTVALVEVIPHYVWKAFVHWSPTVRSAIGELPIMAHATDMAAGEFGVGVVVSYVLLAAMALFCCSVMVSFNRLCGTGARRERSVAMLALVLASVLTVASVLLVNRIGLSVEVCTTAEGVSADRLVELLADTRGDVSATVFMSRKANSFQQVSRAMGALEKESAKRGGAVLKVRYVDPAWDFGDAARLVRSGVRPGCVVFDYGRRRSTVDASSGISERACASALVRLAAPPRRRTICWTCGHGEMSFDDYGPCGMSDLARELKSDGYVNMTIDLAGSATLSSDCALVIVAGAREDMSHQEIARLDAYLRQGGRLLVMMESGEAGGMAGLLAKWGIVPGNAVTDGRTVTGAETLVTDFADHPVTSPLRGGSIAMERPVTFVPSSVVASTSAVGPVSYTGLASSGGACVVALAEHGANIGDDIGYRPPRIVAVGDINFVMNAKVSSRAAANRDFMLNVISFLSGTGAMSADGKGGGVLSSGMDRDTRIRHLVASAGVVPMAFMLICLAVAWRRRRLK